MANGSEYGHGRGARAGALPPGNALRLLGDSRRGPGAVVESQPRWIANGQRRTLPDKRTDDDEERQVATIVYGIANVRPSLQWAIAHVWGETDHVNAVIHSKDAELFEFVSDRLGASPQELRLVGPDGEGGLLGGEDPEREPLVVRFRGSRRPGDFAATVRVVTQAGNVGRSPAARKASLCRSCFTSTSRSP